MGFNRSTAPRELPSGQTLVRVLAGLGMAFAVVPLSDHNIEDALLAASISGMEEDDYRILGVTVVWLDRHRERLNADRLIGLVKNHASTRTQVFWQAMAQRWTSDRRWLRLLKLRSKRVEILRTGSTFQVTRKGEDERFAQTALIVPNGLLRNRPGDAADAPFIAQHHRAYYNRIRIGPSYRADIWTHLEADPTLTPSELARQTYASFATAWQVKRDFSTLFTPSTLT